ncbi:MAG: DEAD/DEAH box helicase, partial [Microthrixaceae bacterium]|nr:DEAD/DEAH box helicase [Microthrixaceae bacterium]
MALPCQSLYNFGVVFPAAPSSEDRLHHAEPAPQTFQDLPLGRRTLWSLDQIGYVTPTPIQAQFIPVAITGVDVIGQAQTGTGKTAAFLLPILEQLRSEPPDPQALVLAPTRELAAQIQAEGSRLADGRGISLISLCGGHSMRNQIEDLRHGCQIAIGTPGRVLHHLRTGELRVQDVRHVVLDEADRMLDIGFRPDIEKILRRCPTERQTLLLSATMPPPVERLAHRYMRDPQRVDLSEGGIVTTHIRQHYVTVD